MLRSTPKYVAEKEIPVLLRKWNFFERQQNWNGEFPNDFVAHDMTVLDRTTGLLWAKDTFTGFWDFIEVRLLVRSLNKDGYAGYHDWRLPTLEEGASLLSCRRRSADHTYIDPLFAPFRENPRSLYHTTATLLLTADYSHYVKDSLKHSRLWIIYFILGQLHGFQSCDFDSNHSLHLRPCRTVADPAGRFPALPAPRPNRVLQSRHCDPVPQPTGPYSGSVQIAAGPASNHRLPAAPLASRIGGRPEDRQPVPVPCTDDDVPQIILLADH